MIGPVIERVAGKLVTACGRPFVPETGAQNTELRHLAQSRSLAVLSIAVVLVHTAGQLTFDLHVARLNGETVISLRPVNRRGVGDGRNVGEFFRVVVVVGIGLYIEIEIVAQLGVQAYVFEIGRHMVGIVLVVQIVDRI